MINSDCRPLAYSVGLRFFQLPVTASNLNALDCYTKTNF
jgi:hypothetical protein